MKAEALFLVRHGEASRAFERRSVDLPDLKAGQVLIETEAFGLNFADVMARHGLYRAAPPPPCVLGYEVAGRVVETAGETSWKKGDRVLGFTRFGGYASHAITDERALVKIPDELDAALATALATQYATAWFAGAISISMHAGEHVLVQAAGGGVGTALVQLAKHKGCIVYGTAGSKEKLEYLRSIGVDHPINYREEEFDVAVRRLNGGKGIDVVFDSIGGKAFKKGFKVLREGGRIVGFGAADRLGKGGIISGLGLLFGFGFWSPIPILTSSKTMAGVNMLAIADHKPDLLLHVMQEVMRLYEAGVFRPKLGAVFEAGEIAAAHQLLESRQSTGKVAVRWK